MAQADHGAHDDGGLTERGLWGISWGLGVLASVAWFTSASLMDRRPALDRELGLWLGVAVMATVFSAACAVLCGVKNAVRGRDAIAADRSQPASVRSSRRVVARRVGRGAWVRLASGSRLLPLVGLGLRSRARVRRGLRWWVAVGGRPMSAG